MGARVLIIGIWYKAVIEGKPRKETIEVLRKANRMATGQMMRGRYSKI